jgi:probable F420-dependent oxidoreductase
MMTSGRLEIGLGAGWARDEYDGAAITFDRPGRRLARLQASVEIIKQALSEGRVERPDSEAFGPIQLDGMPRSIQRPHPPLLIGGGGPRTLRYAAQAADIVGLDPRAMPAGGHVPGDVTAALFDEKVSWLRDAAPERIADLEINVIIFDVDPSFLAGDEQTSITASVPVHEIARSPHYLTGDPTAMVEQLIARRERWGINYLAIKAEHMAVLAPVIARIAGT